jgi:serine/threonine-protein kinase
VDPAGDPRIDTMAGNYRLVARLGSGGMGDVYKAVHATIGSRVAIKVLHADASRHAGDEERFLREAQAVNKIDHDGVVKVLDAGRLDNGRPFLVMELLDGASLAQRAGRLGVVAACRIMIDVLDAIAAAHAVGVVHRDLKPPNIFRTKSGRTVVLDFGVAKLLAPDSVRLTVTGAAVGTPHYMAPEQIRDTVGPSADVYAAGVVLYELLCGRLPFDGESALEVMNSHLQREPVAPRTLRGDIPAAVQDVVMKALAKDTAHRFPSAVAMRDALRDAISEESAAATMRSGAPTKRGAAVAIAVGATAIGVVIAGVWWVMRTPATTASAADAAALATPPAIAIDAATATATATDAAIATAARVDAAPSRGQPGRPTPPRGNGWIEVRSDQVASVIKIDGVVRGKTPWNGPIAAGKHVIDVSSPGFKSFRKRVTVDEGELELVRAELESGQ